MILSSKIKEQIIKQELPPKKALPIMWYKWIWNRINKLNYNYLQITTGDTGAGKTMSNIIDAYIINPKRFSASSVCLGIKEFMDFIEDSKKGDTCILTEGGVVMSNRQWYSIGNILGNFALQTFREKNLGVWIDLPDVNMIDVQVRKLMTAQAVCKRYDNDKVIQYLYKIKVDRKEKGKTYYPYFSFMYRGKRYVMPYIVKRRSVLDIIPKKTLKEINKKVSEFKDKVLKKTKKTADLMDKERFGDDNLEKTEIDYIDEILKNPGDFRLNGKWNSDLIRSKYNLSLRKARAITTILKKHYSDVQPIT